MSDRAAPPDRDERMAPAQVGRHFIEQRLMRSKYLPPLTLLNNKRLHLHC